MGMPSSNQSGDSLFYGGGFRCERPGGPLDLALRTANVWRQEGDRRRRLIMSCTTSSLRNGTMAAYDESLSEAQRLLCSTGQQWPGFERGGWTRLCCDASVCVAIDQCRVLAHMDRRCRNDSTAKLVAGFNGHSFAHRHLVDDQNADDNRRNKGKHRTQILSQLAVGINVANRPLHKLAPSFASLRVDGRCYASRRGEDRRFEIRQVPKANHKSHPHRSRGTDQCRWLGLVLLVARRRDARQLWLPQCAE